MPEPSVIVDPSGKPLRRAKDDTCPRCRAGSDQRVASSGFGAEPHPICARCGYEFYGERL